MSIAPVGPGMFIWQPRYCEGGDWTKIIERLKTARVGWVALHNFGTQLGAVKMLKDVGIYVAYSIYVTPGSTLSCIANSKVAVENGVDAVLFDAELAWEVDSTNPKKLKWWGPQATTFVNSMRAAVGDTYLADAGAWAFPRMHAEYPDREFAAVVDAAMPERYWTEGRTGYPYAAFMEDSETQWTSYPDVQGYKSIIPIGPTYGTNTSPSGGNQPLQQSDFTNFIQTNPTCGLWSYMHTPQWAWDVLVNR